MAILTTNKQIADAVKRLKENLRGCPLGIRYALTSRFRSLDWLETKVLNARYGIENLIRWFPVIWKDRDWDWVFIAEILRRKLLNVSDHEAKYGHHTTSGRDAKDQRVCAELLRRLVADEYAWNAIEHLPKMLDDSAEEERRRAFKHGEKMCRQDLDYLCKILSKRLLCWWD